MRRRELSRQEVEAKPYLVWNAYIDLLASERYEDLTPAQRPPHLAFWYESEVQNGGHLQYFLNRGANQLGQTLEALSLMGASCQRAVLEAAGEVWLEKQRRRPVTAGEFVDLSLEREFSPFDERFHRCDPSLHTCLERYLQEHRSDFIAIS